MLGGQRQDTLLSRRARLGRRAQGQRYRAVNELHVARRVKDALDSGLKLSPEVVARLGVARERALGRHRVVAEELALAAPGRLGARLGSPNRLVTRSLSPAPLPVPTS